MRVRAPSERGLARLAKPDAAGFLRGRGLATQMRFARHLLMLALMRAL